MDPRGVGQPHLERQGGLDVLVARGEQLDQIDARGVPQGGNPATAPEVGRHHDPHLVGSVGRPVEVPDRELQTVDGPHRVDPLLPRQRHQRHAAHASPPPCGDRAGPAQ